MRTVARRMQCFCRWCEIGIISIVPVLVIFHDQPLERYDDDIRFHYTWVFLFLAQDVF